MTLVCALTVHASADVLVQYGFGTDGAEVVSPDYVAAGVTASDFLQGTGEQGSASAFLSDQDGDPTDATLFLNNATTSADAVAAEAYREIIIDGVSQIDTITYTVGAGGTSNAPRQGFLRSSLDGFTADLDSWALSTIPSVPRSVDINAAGLTDPVTFRFYVWNTQKANRGYRLDDVVVNGVPEPASLSLLALGGLALLRRRRA